MKLFKLCFLTKWTLFGGSDKRRVQLGE